MAEDKQNPLLLLLLIALIAAAGFFIMKRVKSGSEQPVSQVYWVCDDCNEETAAPKEWTNNRACPKCNSNKMLIAMKYECPKCKKSFEAYRMTPSAGTMPQVKVKGGQLQPMQVALQRDPRISNPKCPECNSEKTRDWQPVYPPPAKYSDVKHMLPDPDAILQQFDETAPPAEAPR